MDIVQVIQIVIDIVKIIQIVSLNPFTLIDEIFVFVI